MNVAGFDPAIMDFLTGTTTMHASVAAGSRFTQGASAPRKWSSRETPTVPRLPPRVLLHRPHPSASNATPRDVPVHACGSI